MEIQALRFRLSQTEAAMVWLKNLLPMDIKAKKVSDFKSA